MGITWGCGSGTKTLGQGTPQEDRVRSVGPVEGFRTTGSITGLPSPKRHDAVGRIANPSANSADDGIHPDEKRFFRRVKDSGAERVVPCGGLGLKRGEGRRYGSPEVSRVTSRVTSRAGFGASVGSGCGIGFMDRHQFAACSGPHSDATEQQSRACIRLAASK